MNLTHLRNTIGASVITLLVMALPGITSCSEEDSSFRRQGEVVSFVCDSPRSRANGNQWSTSDLIGIASFNASSSQYSTRYHQYKPEIASTHTRLLPVSAAETLYLPYDGTALTFAAFAPYIGTLNYNNMTYNLADQQAEGAMEKVDFIHGKSTVAHTYKEPMVDLHFERKFCRVVINLVHMEDERLGDNALPSLVGTEVTMKNVYSKAVCNVKEGTLGTLTSGTIKTYCSSVSDNNATFQAIVIPQTSTSPQKATNRTLTFKINNVDYTFPIPDDYEAGKSYTYNCTFSPNGVIVPACDVVPWETGATVWSGQRTIAADVDSLHFSASYATKTFTVRTKGISVKPTVSRSTSAASVTGTPATINATAIGDGTPDGDWTKYTVTVTANSNTTGAARSEAYVHIAAEGLSVVVPVMQTWITDTDILSNCYIVDPGYGLTFPVTRAYEGNSALADYTSTFNTAILWDDNQALEYAKVTGSGQDAKITVQARTNHGNALVALLNTAGTIVWSYHIWVTDYTPDPNLYSGFMDRNLGATTITEAKPTTLGLLYQWGRKDPFPNSASIDSNVEPSWWTVKKQVADVTLDYSIKHPATYFPTTSWLGSDGDNSWADTKTLYDPCPVGYRVPSNGAWGSTSAGWTPQANNHGQSNPTYGGYYPVAGNRTRDTGSITNLSTYGHYWSCTANGSEARILYLMNDQTVNPQMSLERLYGFSVRCITE